GGHRQGHRAARAPRRAPAGRRRQCRRVCRLRWPQPRRHPRAARRVAGVPQGRCRRRGLPRLHPGEQALPVLRLLLFLGLRSNSAAKGSSIGARFATVRHAKKKCTLLHLAVVAVGCCRICLFLLWACSLCGRTR
uniref:Uncharacterized protein n=1 Tax=Aegilops tauschii subsp. strangulata TaxID=200361 RepID=A0A453RJK5_AEGTS